MRDISPLYDNWFGKYRPHNMKGGYFLLLHCKGQKKSAVSQHIKTLRYSFSSPNLDHVDLFFIHEVMKDNARVRVNKNTKTTELERVMSPMAMTMAWEAHQNWKLEGFKCNMVQNI